MPLYHHKDKHGVVTMVRRMAPEVASALNAELAPDGGEWIRGMHRRQESVAPHSLQVLLRELSLEGFNEHSVNTIRQILRQEAKEAQRRVGAMDADVRKFSDFMRTHPPEIRNLVGRVMARQASMSFSAGLRAGMAAHYFESAQEAQEEVTE